MRPTPWWYLRRAVRAWPENDLMATIGHLAAGVAIGRAARLTDLAAAIAITGAAVMPDVDFALGINHRGPTHSLGFAAAAGLAAFVAFRLLAHARPGAVGLLVAGAVVSHIVLDLLTAHSPVAVLWPLSSREFVLSVTVLPSAPTDESLLSARGGLAAALEVAWSALLILAAGWRPGRGADGQEPT